ncbi:TraC family protein [Pseudoalteromonas luteoviolacea]|uniref:TraC family protein n=1 Tax=Pseudoalteromonas luteoviolacea TaxID=43657 RepID=UPI001B38736C|nr:TraC family protein [Pseudoalteromonas luteoviolacea]MBQ4839841.1 TraC family protein [Pseudoalteromonas luteoviolacea]
MFESVMRTLFGDKGGVTATDVEKMSQRDKLSDFLPYLYCSPDGQGEYLNMDNTIGYIWECCPLTFASMRQIKQIESILRAAFSNGSVMQFIFVADKDVKHIIDAYRKNKLRDHPLVQKNIAEYADFLQSGVSGLNRVHNIPIRNFRLFVTLKAVEGIPDDTLSIVEESLKGANLAPQRMKSHELIHWLRTFFNNLENTDHTVKVDKTVPLRKQIIDSQTEVSFNSTKRYVKIGQKYARCITPKGTRGDIDPLLTNELAGGIMGNSDDSNQMLSPFIWSVSLVFGDAKFELHQKASITMSQKSTGSFAREIGKRVNEFMWATDKAESENFLQVIPSLWVFSDSEEELREATSRAVRIWEGKDFQMQEESILQKPLLISALPFGLYNVKNNVKVMDRDFLFPISTVSRFLPIQGDFFGGSKPVLMYFGRKGQLCGLDVFDSRANNHNFMVCAESGSGKSFMLNKFLGDYYASGSLVRAVDLGYSYQKLCTINNGRFIDVGKENIVINPFHSNAKDDEDLNKDLIAAANVIAEMAYSASGSALHETEWTLIKSAVFWAYREGEIINGVDAVQRYLAHFPKYDDLNDVPDLNFAKQKASELALNLRDFTTRGPYGRFFNGEATFDISSDEFVVLELEQLKGQRELFSVIVMQVMNAVTQDLYLSDRGTQRFILFEEAASMLKKQGHTDMSRLAGLIEEGYRRARKYYGSFGVVLQSVLDTVQFGEVGEVLLNNAAFKFYLEGKDYSKAARDKVIPYDGLALELLNSVRNAKPRYSEMMVDSSIYKGVARLCVDPWNYWISTSAGDEVHAFNTLLSKGYKPIDAIAKLSGIPIQR